MQKYEGFFNPSYLFIDSLFQSSKDIIYGYISLNLDFHLLYPD